MLKCAHCPDTAHAVRNGIALCIEHWREARDERPLRCHSVYPDGSIRRLMMGCQHSNPPVPEQDGPTPIYDKLKAERGEARIVNVPLVDVSAKRTQKVLAELGFYQPLQKGIKRAIDAEARAHHAYMAPVGTPLDAPGWEPLGYLSQDGIQLDTGQDEIREWGGDLIRTTTSFEETFTFKAEKSNRHVLKLVFGVYRLPDDRPLIHKGRKP